MHAPVRSAFYILFGFSKELEDNLPVLTARPEKAIVDCLDPLRLAAMVAAQA